MLSIATKWPNIGCRTALPGNVGLSAVELCSRGVRQARSRRCWIGVYQPPAASMPDQTLIHEALAACPLLWCAGTFATTEILSLRDLLLPSRQLGEKAGQRGPIRARRITACVRALPHTGEARPDWAIVCDRGHTSGSAVTPGQPSLFELRAARNRCSMNNRGPDGAGRDLDYRAALSYALIDDWARSSAVRRGYTERHRAGSTQIIDFRTESHGRARFICRVLPAAIRRQRDARFPLTFENTGPPARSVCMA